MLSACSSNPPKPQVPDEIKQPPPPVLPVLDPIKTESVQWRIVEVGGETLFALPARGYEALARNLADTIRWVQEASWQMDFYRRTRTPEEEAAE